jgi:hypothetical protein
MFLFPTKPFIDSSLESCAFERKGHKPCELFELIDARYRKADYAINWLLFSKDDNLSEPDLSQVPDYLKFHKKDNILNAGISFGSHISEKIYADPGYVLNQLPYHNKIVLGGFHQWDCVDKIAECSHGRGVETFVDEDTTDLFFGKRAHHGIPVKRKKWDLEALGLSGSPEYIIEFARKSREGRPWFVQI